MVITGDILRHKPTCKIGKFVEHVNVGVGYMVKPNDGTRMIMDKPENFEKFTKGPIWLPSFFIKWLTGRAIRKDTKQVHKSLNKLIKNWESKAWKYETEK